MSPFFVPSILNPITMNVTAKFLGGSGVVTGSKYLIDLGDFGLVVARRGITVAVEQREGRS